MPTVYSPPVSTYVSLATITLASTDSEIVFSSIPATYRDLIVVITGLPSGNFPIDVEFNGDTTNSNYFGVFAYNQGATTDSFTENTSYSGVNWYTSNGQTTVIYQIMDYSATNKHKTYLSRSGGAGNWVAMGAIRWANTAAINSILIDLRGGSFTIGTTLSLYAIAS